MRDALLERPVKEISIIVGGTYDELRRHLHHIFISHGKPIPENELFEESSQQLGQFKIMSFVVRTYNHFINMHVKESRGENRKTGANH